MTSENWRHKESGEKENERIREEVGARIVCKIVKPGGEFFFKTTSLRG